MEKGAGPSKGNKVLAYCYITSHMTPIHSGKQVANFITLHLEVVYPSWDSIPSSGKLSLLYPLFQADGFHSRKWPLCKLSFIDGKLRPIERKYFFQDFTVDSFQDSLTPWFQHRGWWFYFHVSNGAIFFFFKLHLFATRGTWWHVLLREWLKELILSFYWVVPEDWTQVIHHGRGQVL